MALRQIRCVNDSILRKESRDITNINDRIITLLDDMAETMYENEGVGLAAPQVGVLRKAVVIDVGEGLWKLINPEVIEKDGESIDIEGCLSIPGRAGKVKRPEKVKVKYLDVDGKEQILEGEGLLARALCHEIDHLKGVLFIDKIVEEIEVE